MGGSKEKDSQESKLDKAIRAAVVILATLVAIDMVV
jgi:hypothetical protein